MNSDGLMTTVQPGRQRRRQLPAHQHQGRIPRRDERAHADRLLQDVGEVVGPVGGHHGALNLVGEAAVVVEPLGQILGLRVHLRHQLAVVAHLDLGQMLGVLLDQAADAAQQLAARGLRHGGPRPLLEGAPGCLAGAVHVLGVAFGDQRPRLAGIGVVRLELLARGRLAPLAVDVGLILLELRWAIQHGKLLLEWAVAPGLRVVSGSWCANIGTSSAGLHTIAPAAPTGYGKRSRQPCAPCAEAPTATT